MASLANLYREKRVELYQNVKSGSMTWTRRSGFHRGHNSPKLLSQCCGNHIVEGKKKKVKENKKKSLGKC